jgi:hypothetical protein
VVVDFIVNPFRKMVNYLAGLCSYLESQGRKKFEIPFHYAYAHKNFEREPKKGPPIMLTKLSFPWKTLGLFCIYTDYK